MAWGIPHYAAALVIDVHLTILEAAAILHVTPAGLKQLLIQHQQTRTQ